ncbi:alpha-2-macroglobulin-like protein 1 [Mantella aurantiaca]
MVSWVLCAGLVLLHISCSIKAELHYAIIFPSEIRSERSEIICIHLEGAQGESRVQISLHLEGKSTTLVEKRFEKDSIFTCVPIQVSRPKEMQLVGTLNVSIENAGETVANSTKVLVKRRQSSILVQSDKPVYKPGQEVKFRILSINEDLQPRDFVIPVVELQDPGKNRIGQWLNVSLNQGMAELSLPLSSEPPLGEYSIRVKDTVHTISVEEYVLPKFEVTLQFPKVVMFNSEQFPLRVCGRYTYGKPVQGNYTASVCQKRYIHWWRRTEDTNNNICAKFSGKLDRLGCDTIDVNSEVLKLRNPDMERTLHGEASITEDGTGIELSTSSRVAISNVINKVSFVDTDRNYKSGIPFSGVVKVVDSSDNPIADIEVHLTSVFTTINKTLVTDDSGKASFTINTNKWMGEIVLSARVNMQDQPFVFGIISPVYGRASLELNPFYSRSQSFLKLHSHDRVLPCEGQQEVQVEYIIKHTELKNNADHFDLHYVVTSKGSIQDYGSLEISAENKNEDLYGKSTLKLPLRAGRFSTFRALVYTILSDGEILADSAVYKVQQCFQNKVSVGFSPDEVLPGLDVSLQVQAAPGSLCGLRVVDQSVVLMKPEKELTADKVFNLFPFSDDGRYDYRIKEHKDHCSFYPFHLPRPPFGPSGPLFMPRWAPLHSDDQGVDVYSLFEGIKLKILTSSDIKKPVACPIYTVQRGMPGFGGPQGPILFSMSPDRVDGRRILSRTETIEEKEKEKVRTYFPETWLWKLISVGESGSANHHHKAPDTITDWNAGAICLGQSGFGLSFPASLRVFQPFFVDLALPYSVVRGETFILKASVFNYLKQCIKIKVTLGPIEEIVWTPCTDCIYSSCLCADESKTFYWNMEATKLGEVNITVRTEAVNTNELCENEIPIVPKQGATDTIVKPILVQPGGVLVEKSHSSLLCIQEGEDKTEEVSLQFPSNILKDSERAYVTVLGDIIGTALQNLDRLLAMPYGCGEQNMVLFAPNIFILQYLHKTHQMTDEIKKKAIRFLENGYQRQLTYKRDDGSYSAFGKSDSEGNTWLSAFVMKSFSQGRPYIFIDEGHLKQSFTWLQKIRKETGCFRNVGRLLNTAMKGGVEDEVSLSAYVTMALIESGVSLEDPLVRDAVSCLRKSAVDVNNVYTLALLAYTFTLCGESELRMAVLNKLEDKAIRGDGQLHWKRDSGPPIQDSFWYRAPSAEVEMTAYVLLALLYGSNPDLGKASEIVSWLSKQQNPYGGFSSTQDTVVALQALAKYSELTFSDKGDVTVTVSANSGFLEKFHVDKNNRLLLQRASLPAVNGEYMVTATGSSCVFVQTVLRYNVPPPRSDISFSLRVTTHLTRGCLEDPVTNFEIRLNTTYTGNRDRTNMAVIEVKMLSGYIPIKSTVKKLQKDKLIQRSEIQADMVTLYLNEVGHDPVKLSFMVEQDVLVKDLKPATVKVYDYYETDEQAVTEYNHPCNMDMELNKDHVSLLNKGLGFVPTCGGDEFEIYKDLQLFLRRVNLKLLYGRDKVPPIDSSLLLDNRPEDQHEDNWLLSPLLDPLPISGLKNKSTRIPSISTNRHIQMFFELVSKDIRTLNWSTLARDNLSRGERRALGELEHNRDIVIKPSDKGGNVVIWKVEAYMEEANRQLSDPDCYTKIPTNPFPPLVAEINDVLKHAKQVNLISKKEYDYLMIREYNIPTFYMLPKVHKNLKKPPGRPIVSGMGSPLDRLGKFVDRKLRHLVSELTSFILDSSDILRKLESHSFPQDGLLVGIDVESLYSSIPHDIGIKAVPISFKTECTQPFPPKLQQLDALILSRPMDLRSEELSIAGMEESTITG